MWTFTIPDYPDVAVTQESITSGELALMFGLVNDMIPHLEGEIAPWHCPLCRRAVAIVAIRRTAGPGIVEIPVGLAAKLVDETAPADLIAMIGESDGERPPVPAVVPSKPVRPARARAAKKAPAKRAAAKKRR